jgi:Arc/MetJ-type ribon-helix-helix transcriptional regulator
MTDKNAEKVRMPITIRMPEAILKAIDDQVKKE